MLNEPKTFLFGMAEGYDKSREEIDHWKSQLSMGF